MAFSIRKKQARLSRENKIKIYFSPSKKVSFQKLITTRRKVKQQVRRANKKVAKLESDLSITQNKMKEMSSTTFSKLIEDSQIPKCQSTLLYEIFEAARYKNPKSRRYSESWMILCLLFQIW